MWIVELYDGCWFAPWDGDPGRTLVRESAEQFKSKAAAKRALDSAKNAYGSFRDFSQAKIIPASEKLAAKANNVLADENRTLKRRISKLEDELADMEAQIALYRSDVERIWELMPEMRGAEASYEIHEAVSEKLLQAQKCIAALENERDDAMSTVAAIHCRLKFGGEITVGTRPALIQTCEESIPRLAEIGVQTTR